MGNLTKVTYDANTNSLAANVVTYAYDRDNRLTTMLDSAGTTTYGYANGLLASENGPWAEDTVSYADNNGQRQSLALVQPNASAWVESYGYDGGRRLTSVTTAAGTFGYMYAGAGSLVTSLALPGVWAITNQYDAVGRLTGTWLRGAGGVITNQHLYAYNTGSQRTRQTRLAGDYVDYTYDDNGNLVSDGQMTFEYDGENQLVAVQVAGSWRSEFRYDGKLRRRVRVEKLWQNSQWVTASETRYVYDGMLVVQERDGNDLPAVSYTRGRDLSGTREGGGGIGGLLARTDSRLLIVGDPSAHANYHADGNGNVTALVNSTQGILAQYLYDPNGNLLAQAGPLADANLYRFSSKELHPTSSLYYYGYRYYFPNLQRWPNRDPINELGHRLLTKERPSRLNRDQEKGLYVFVRNSPPNYYDKDGRLVGYVIGAIAVAGYACAAPQVAIAERDHGNASDKFRHCWVSCRISKTCGNDLAQLAGLSKEVKDRAVEAWCDRWPDSLICQLGGGPNQSDWWDTVQDLVANQQCIGWESRIAGPVGGWIGALCRRSCEDCCRAKVGYY